MVIQFLLLLMLVSASHARRDRHTGLRFQAKDNGTDDQSPDVGLFPVVFNLAARAQISANATCGEETPETYCRLVEHVRRRPGDKIQCGICDANSPDPRDHHPISHAIDGSNRWWQSPSIAMGLRYHWVTITVDLQQVYQVAYIIIKAANSPRPGNWILEKSVDGETFTPWQYFASSDSECLSVYNIRPTIGIPRYRRDDHVICTSSYSRLDPMQNGEIHISLVNGRPGVTGPSQQLQDFTTARYIRLRLQKIRTLNADLMTLMSNDPRDLDASVTNRYFYSIKDISVGGQCICYGHARYCPINRETGELECTCERNTCGKTCEKCCPLFNQKPWKPGTYTEGSVCEECNCFGHAQECVYNNTVAESHLSLNIYGEFEGGGVCQDCQHNTMGINCEMCIDGYYRPSEVDHRQPDACKPCACDSQGSLGICIKDDSRKDQALYAGDCVCREGFAGRKCESCAAGYRNYPYCEACPCSSAGSLNYLTCEDDCQCKNHVTGSLCDTCLAGFFNLQHDHYEGCDACFCFSISSQCSASNWGRVQIETKAGWVVTDEAGSGQVTPVSSEQGLTIHSWQTENLGRVLYWSAPQPYLGDKVASYGGLLQYSFQYDVNGTCEDEGICENYLANYDVIIEGGGLRLGYQGRYYPDTVEGLVAMNLTEENWRYLDMGETSHPEAGRGDIDTLVSREDFMMVLAQLDRLLIRATYHVFQTKSLLLYVSLDVASELGTGDVMPSVEMCRCPVGYAGSSCQSCQPGYRRVGNILLGGICEPCQCHGHASQCDPFTGECLECEHNTQGAHCELCQIGYIGDARRGTAEDCRPCACPFSTQSFAQGCVRDSNYPNREYICVGCQPGYEGLACERCSLGYFGDPLVLGGSCQPCDCHGNVDLVAPGSCSLATGECYGCQSNTEGPYCERCKEGYYGTALNGDCKPCSCNVFGSRGSQCDPVTGQCECRERYTTLDCGQCQAGYGNIEAGCVPCDCDFVGSVSDLCDAMTGQCPCKPGVGGPRCERCRTGHYDFSMTGCASCGCEPLGTNGTACDTSTGQCLCLPHVIGLRCDVCEAEHWGLALGVGCEPCQCNTTGSLSSQCDLASGQCDCKPGISGRHCDECIPGYYGFSSYGCKECPVCSEQGKVCDPVTGECVCPPNTRGPYCESCMLNTWGHHPLKGCQKCECSSTGSVGNECDVVTGACVCHSAFTGDKCDQCHRGYYDFPLCRSCDCDPAGTQALYCDASGHCQCNRNGTCPCKLNVGHEKCVYCKPGTFSLQLANPKGCTACYCFGRSTRCQQAERVWNQVPLGDMEVGVGYYDPRTLIYPDANGILAIPYNQALISVGPGHLYLPIYWTLPPDVQGDRILSYGGRLQFHLESVPDPVPSQAPIVHMIGNFKLHLVYPMPQAVAENGDYMVTFREDLWTTDDGDEVTREMMMVALQNVNKIYVFAAPAANITKASLRKVSLDVADPAPGHTPGALGVEQCVCPHEYIGTSCQNPAPGFFRRRPEDFITSEVIVDLIGYSEPCLCNGHSNECHPETGVCLNCNHHTASDYCELCETGYYGNATIGTVFDCEQCGCPLFTPENNFSPTCIPTQDGGDYICNACPEGHTGSRCERCAVGYYGNPLQPGSKCRPCGCSQEGSISSVCDGEIGQCVCRPGIQGRACDKCSPRYALVNGVCTSCDEGCPGIIMVDLDMMSQAVEQYNTSAEVLLPWRYIARIEKDATEMRNMLTTIEVGDLQSMHNAIVEEEIRLENLRAKMKAVSPQQNLKEAQTEARDSRREVQDLARIARDTHRHVEETVRMLNEFASGQREESLDVVNTLTDAEESYWQMQDRQHVAQALAAENELEKAKEKLERIEALGLRETNLTRVKTHGRDVSSKLKDLIEHSVQVGNVSTQAMDLNWRNKQDLYDMTQEVEDVTKQSEQLKVTNTNATAINDKAAFILWNISSDNYRPFCILDPAKYSILNESQFLGEACLAARQSLQDSEESLQVKGGLLEQNLPDAQAQVDEAHRHAQQLQQTADNLEQQFANTRTAAADPLRAVKAYSDISTALDEADAASNEAVLSADQALTKSEDFDGTSLKKKAADSLALSRELLSNASSLKTSVQERLERNEEAMESEDQNINMAQQDLRYVNQQLANFSSDISPTVRVLNYRASKAEEKANKILANLTEKIDKLEQAGPMLQQLSDDAEMIIRNTSTSVKAVDEEISKVLNLTDVLTERIKVIEELHTEVTLNLEELRRNIKLAREQANSIKLSMKSTGDCIRKYKPEIKPSTTNTIVAHFTTNRTSNNMMLFFVGKAAEGEFMAVELIQRKVKFTWDIGTGPTFIEHKLLVEPAYQNTKLKDQWYKVEAQRIGNLGRLSVMKLSSQDDPEVVTGVSSPANARLDLDDLADLFVGGLPASYELPGNLQGKQFYGCMGEAYLDGKHVGLWNFREIEGRCDGCGIVPVPTEKSEVYQFQGDGFASVNPLSRFTNRRFSVILQIKTYWDNAMIFFTANDQSGDFVSIELKEGLLVFRLSLDGKRVEKLVSTYNYNTNNWVTVTASWDSATSIMRLRVEDEIVQERISRTGGGMLDLSNTKMHFAGVPPGVNHTRYDLETNGFLGCMRGIQVSSRGTYIQNLYKGVYTGMELGCKTDVWREMGLGGDGYLEIAPEDLLSEGGLAFSFRTSQPDALLLIALATDSQKFYSVSLLDGRLMAWFSGGPGLATIQSTQSYNDGNLHTVFFVKVRDVIDMFVNDELVGSAIMPPGARDIVGLAEGGSMYLGGVPRGVDIIGKAASDQPLQGCMGDIIINKNLKYLDSPKDFRRADVGRCDPKHMVPAIGGDTTKIPGLDETSTTTRLQGYTITVTRPMTTPPSTTTLEPTFCARQGRYGYVENAVTFGDVKNSHAEIDVEEDAINKGFTITLEMRTLYKTGLLLYITNKQQSDFIAVQLNEGRLIVSYDDRGITRDIDSQSNLNDGNWHSVAVTKDEKSISLQVDKLASTSGRITRRVDVNAPLYVGGLPKAFRATAGIISESFKGCIRSFYINKDYVDLVNSKAVMGVRQCFSNFEEGTHLNGYGYAVYAEKFEIYSDFESSFEFRTTQMNGVLMSTSDFSGYPALAVEIHEGKLKFNVVNYYNEKFSVESDVCEHCLCNNRWHSVTVRMRSGRLYLQLDERPQLSRAGPVLSLDTYYEFFIGGFPVYAMPQGATSSGKIFEGCLKNLVIQKEDIKWHSNSRLVDIHVADCPVSIE